MKLKNKIHLGTSVLLVVIVILMNTAVYFAASFMLREADVERAAADAAQIAGGVSSPAESITSSDLLRAYAPANGMVRVILPDGTVDGVAVSPDAAGLRERAAAFTKGENREIIRDDKGSSYARVALPVIWRGGEVASLELWEDLQATERILTILRGVLFAALLIAVIPAVISARVLGAIISNPVEQMTETMRRIRKSGTHERIETNGSRHDELQDMALTFNDMMNLLEENYRKQEAFVQNASHELKTPLTVVESYARLLKRRGKDHPDLFDESVEAIYEEALRMKELTQQLLALARRDETWNVKMETIDMAVFVRETADSFQRAYKRRVNVRVKETCRVKTDRAKLRQLLFIFLDNARKYSEKEICIEVEKQEIRVIDQGMGIPASDLLKVFDRFYRVDKARTRKTGGFGLGLSLAKELADALGIILRIESEEGRGTIVILTFSECSSAERKDERGKEE
ncbi:HAMP domain-containing sensor histidine kinase [Domibacillus sp. DTU_2020_1001157_1_SI_ALB_TIR_016]|uniref:sensor histidine kinase n=1 Tax=Domibacillus sp. DTU_2020_1001157_1_SI_ALB_TIR_016 TaxID=3077789 RepID=UPI0028E58190|nr:HAMP domain-containing sensor histidine kinase [Domibacillus sp. DTU_2020_1001157_1_SI_ALB_TIR_016]WNS79931.1 HAMP domain-containing sensor histidine kinase [Domibacillus sp. DTU_2020_1001157_1_SI_ALB_TIR_016]